mmetsp:Transcript_28298/g.51577  ORF Transcript_28298/g.51577 Transcript_28298/m.51577 type:complete len:188 (-) Transcript_28298:150-713(-)|eukprot:CAMPEP_0201626226 /NCGR_PEP_ID=MMETSP0493-20130528/1716_1 /ASSEMBLY_ACC=CAM_ASM_000838 /TAXON_ID=420259 /ORGANISM="Thalassiosira gravida, Strain GMp14c1" /LENGTH=187 /DNA_ID=CAMNT_0048096311 /DNA_START=90 /DNA_END=653 /DNA_ORIENTATION=-
MTNKRGTSGQKNRLGKLSNSIAVPVAILMSHIDASTSLSLNMVASSWNISPSQLSPTNIIGSSSSRVGLNVPTVELSQASSRGINSTYNPQDPNNIPTGFARMCNKAGGFAPRPVWDDITNGVTPWFESKDGFFLYFNCNDVHWYVDNPSGAGMYLAVPDGSLLLPPTAGWVSLTGRRAGAPKISFV